MKNTCLTYNLTLLLIALVSICVLRFESVIKFIAHALKTSTHYMWRRTCYFTGAPEFILGFYLCSCYPIFSFLCRSLFVLLFWPLCCLSCELQLLTTSFCFSEYLCTSFWKCYQIYCACIKNIYPFFFEEKLENTKEVVRSCNSQDRQHNGQKKKRTNNDLQRKLKIG
jgi:hypothetical protein